MDSAHGAEDIGEGDSSYLIERRIEPGVSISQAVVETIAVASDTPMEDLSPLHSEVDTDALDALFAPLQNGDLRPKGTISFEYGDHHVHVDGKKVKVRPAESES